MWQQEFYIKLSKLICLNCFIILLLNCFLVPSLFAQKESTPTKETEAATVKKDGKAPVVDEKKQKQIKIEDNTIPGVQKDMYESEMPLKKMEYLRSKQKILRQYHRPTTLQVAIYNANGVPKSAYKLSVYLGKVKKRQIEERLGVHFDIINIVDTPLRYAQTIIYFRENYLKSALFLASLIPGDQRILPLPNQELSTGVDILIYVGKDS